MPPNPVAVKPPPSTTTYGVIHPGEGCAYNPEEPLLGTSQECDVTSDDEPLTREPRPGVEIIKAIVYGGLARVHHQPKCYNFCCWRRCYNIKSDNKDNKLIELASASLACIALLSAAKAHVRAPPAPKNYMATVFYYLGVGFSVSGLGYVAGHFINILLKKVGVFDPAAAAPEAGDVNGGLWASY